MKKGKVVEYIEKQKIIAAVVIEEKKGRFRLLTENDREVNFSENRLSHVSESYLDTSTTRDFLVKQLKKITQNRKALSDTIDIKELWEILHEESEEIDIPTMAHLCFDPPVTPDHEAAVLRAFFNDRLYFKFGKTGLTACSSEQLEEKMRQLEAARERERLIEKGAEWIMNVASDDTHAAGDADPEIINILKWYYLLEKQSETAATAKIMLDKARLKSPDQIFTILVKAGIWDKDENTDLYRLEIETGFPDAVISQSHRLAAGIDDLFSDPKRKDMTDLPIVTIDGQATLDYDDAVSLEKVGDEYILSVHIIDVGCYIKTGDLIDLDARSRGSSIYMPDQKISMLPPRLSEDLCSLKQGEIRPSITTRVKMNRFFEIIEWQIVPGVIKVDRQMTYFEANLLNGKEEPITTLYKMATFLRDKRMKAGAIQITLPEINIWLEEETKEIKISKVDRENPSRMLISEFMILANSLMARFLAASNVPAVFRSQSEPNERLFRGIETSIFLNVMQRKKLSRAIIGPDPEFHTGLGLEAYVTATSPIRRYYDLITQRQIRSVLGYEEPASREDIEEILQLIATPVANANKIQALRRKYWTLKYLETMKGETFQSVVLESHKDFYIILIKELMFEWKLPAEGLILRPGDIVDVTVQYANARRDQLSLFA